MNASRFPVAAGLVLTLIVVAIALSLSGAGQQGLMELLGLIEQGRRDHLLAMILIHIAAFAILATLTLPVGTLLCLSAGYLFGLWTGFLVAMGGALLAAALTFALVRRFGGTGIRQRLVSGRAGAWIEALERDATWYLIVLRIVPVAPYFGVNAAAAIIGITFVRYLVATTIGLVPTTLVYAAVGNGLDSLIDAREMLGRDLLLRPDIGLPLAALLALVMVSWFIRRRLQPPQA